MMNYIWTAIILLSVLFSVFNGNVNELSAVIFTSAQDAVQLIIRLLGVFCFWGGIMQIAEKSDVTKFISKALSPFLKLIFKDIDQQPELKNAVSMNITANLLGLGNAATPLGIEAMKRFKPDILQKNRATNNMILFVVINTASVRIIPTTVAMMRMEHGSAAPMEILPAAVVTSVSALAVGIIVAKLCEVKKIK